MVAVIASEDLDTTADLTLDLYKDLAPEKDLETLSGSEPLSLENEGLPTGEFSLGSLDEIQQFLTDSVTASAGPVDPVFVDHEDSQNATHMDSLVFDPTLHSMPGIEGMKSHSIPGMDDMNEPRLDSVCNSTIHSTEGSLILGNDFEDGELPSSPEVPEKIESEKEDEKKMDFIDKIDDKEIAKIASQNRPVEQIESDDDSEAEEKIIKKKKKTKKRKKEAKDSETERDELENANVPRRHSKHKKSKQTLPCHKPETNHSKPSSNSLDDKITYHKSSNKTDSNAKLSKLSTKSTKSVDDEKRTNSKSCPYKPRNEDDPKSSIHQKGNGVPPLPQTPPKQSLPISVVNNNPPPPPPEQTIKANQNIKIELNIKNSPSTSEDTDEKTSQPESPNSEKKKCKKLSLKDYKAKKEAEKQRKSLEGSGSESNSTPASEAPSKEPSPAPEPAKFKEVLQPEAEKSKVDIPNSSENIPEPSKDSQMEVEDTLNATEPLDMEPISDNDMDTGHVEEENDVLRGFDVLDEIDDIETDNEISKDSGEDSDSLAEDEVDQMLEEDVPKPSGDDKEEIEPQEKLKKLVLEERGQNGFEVLPLGWVSVTHNSGIPLYLHRDTRVVSTSRPYDLGNGSVRKHNIPISAIPCYSYRYYSKLGEASSPALHNPSSTSTEQPGNANSGPASSVQSATSPTVPSCPYSSSNTLFTRENVSPDSTTDGALTVDTSPTTTTITATPAAPDQPVSVPTVDTNIFPRAQIETIEETLRKTELCPEEVTKYCEKIFVFKELEVAKFKTWKERRAYYKQSQKKKYSNTFFMELSLMIE